jgi:hypothetical protein
MPQKSLGAGLLVLVELGAPWPHSVVESSVHESKRVLVELEGEGPLAFAERVRTTIGTLFPRGVSLELAVVSCNERADADAMAARRLIARSFFGRRALPRLVFATHDASREPFRRALAELVAELSRAERARASVALAAREPPRTNVMARVA